MDTLQTIKDYQIISIVRGAKKEDILKIASALNEGGIKLIEVTLNSPGALQSIEAIAREFDGVMKVGAGTVLGPEEAYAAINAGADFILSPTVCQKTIQITKRHNKISIPGAFTPTEILTAFEAGGDVIKVFPASIGPGYIKDIKGPLPQIPLLPTGGIDVSNIAEFKKVGAVGFGIGSSLVNSKIECTVEELSNITSRARELVKAIDSE